jgi:hypothetical protein
MMPCKWKLNSCSIHRVIELNMIGSILRFRVSGGLCAGPSEARALSKFARGFVYPIRPVGEIDKPQPIVRLSTSPRGKDQKVKRPPTVGARLLLDL